MRFVLILLTVLLTQFLLAQKTATLHPRASSTPKKEKKQELNDFVCVLHEESINKVLNAIGDIKGSSEYEVMLIKGTYHWTIQEAKINVRPDSSSFTCVALVNVGPFDYKTNVIGDVKINYDNDSNMIYIRISRAIFELYTVFFGKKIHLKDIHLEEHFKDPFQFEGPRTMATEMEFTMPDSTRKKIFLTPTECQMKLKFKEICTSCEIAAAEVRTISPIKLIPPIEGVKTPTSQVPQTDKK